MVVGRPFTVVLADRPGSGHLWDCQALPGGVRLADTAYAAGVADAVGAWRDKEFHLVADRAGTFTVTFELRRPWEAAPVEEQVVEVRATPA